MHIKMDFQAVCLTKRFTLCGQPLLRWGLQFVFTKASHIRRHTRGELGQGPLTIAIILKDAQTHGPLPQLLSLGHKRPIMREVNCGPRRVHAKLEMVGVTGGLSGKKMDLHCC